MIDIKTASPQRLFTHVARHLLKQNQKSVDDFACAYYGNGKLKSAVGCLIPKEAYYPGLEGRDSNWVAKILDWPGHLDPFIKEISICHDHHQVEDWPTVLMDIAEKLELRPPPFLVKAAEERNRKNRARQSNKRLVEDIMKLRTLRRAAKKSGVSVRVLCDWLQEGGMSPDDIKVLRRKAKEQTPPANKHLRRAAKYKAIHDIKS